MKPNPHEDAAYLSRHVGLRAGMSIQTPALTVNRLCGSGFQSLINGAQDIITGEADIVVTGGTENMSQAPYALRGVRSGTRYGVELSVFYIFNYYYYYYYYYDRSLMPRRGVYALGHSSLSSSQQCTIYSHTHMNWCIFTYS